MPLEEVEKSADLIMDSVLHKKPRKIKKIKSKGIVQLNQVHSPCLSEVYPLNETIQSKEVREI